MYNYNDDVVNSLIGTGTRYRGDIEFSGILRIDGEYVGQIETDGQVIVGHHARVACTVHAAIVVVGGIFCGTIVATHSVIILSEALFIGIIRSPRCTAEIGCKMNGELCIASLTSPDNVYLSLPHKGHPRIP